MVQQPAATNGTSAAVAAALDKAKDRDSGYAYASVRFYYTPELKDATPDLRETVRVQVKSVTLVPWSV